MKHETYLSCFFKNAQLFVIVIALFISNKNINMYFIKVLLGKKGNGCKIYRLQLYFERHVYLYPTVINLQYCLLSIPSFSEGKPHLHIGCGLYTSILIKHIDK